MSLACLAAVCLLLLHSQLLGPFSPCHREVKVREAREDANDDGGENDYQKIYYHIAMGVMTV